MDLTDKVSLVTGGSRMGLSIARALAERGSHLVITYRRSRKSALEISHAVRTRHRDTLLVQADLTKGEDVGRLFSSIESRFHRLDVLIHMASIYEKTPLRRLNERSWHENMNINLRTAYVLSLEAARRMKRNRMGRIVYFSDWIAQSGRPRYRDYLPYYVSKTGVLGLTQAMALELAPDILVNCIAPGPILPPRGMKRAENRKVILATPLKRWGGPEEIAKGVLFLVDTDFVTGECIRVDGGRHLF